MEYNSERMDFHCRGNPWRHRQSLLPARAPTNPTMRMGEGRRGEGGSGEGELYIYPTQRFSPGRKWPGGCWIPRNRGDQRYDPFYHFTEVPIYPHLHYFQMYLHTMLKSLIKPLFYSVFVLLSTASILPLV